MAHPRRPAAHPRVPNRDLRPCNLVGDPFALLRALGGVGWSVNMAEESPARWWGLRPAGGSTTSWGHRRDSRCVPPSAHHEEKEYEAAPLFTVGSQRACCHEALQLVQRKCH